MKQGDRLIIIEYDVFQIREKTLSNPYKALLLAYTTVLHVQAKRDVSLKIMKLQRKRRKIRGYLLLDAKLVFMKHNNKFKPLEHIELFI